MDGRRKKISRKLGILFFPEMSHWLSAGRHGPVGDGGRDGRVKEIL